jgi:hypothetical protein
VRVGIRFKLGMFFDRYYLHSTESSTFSGCMLARHITAVTKAAQLVSISDGAKAVSTPAASRGDLEQDSSVTSWPG